MFDDNMNIKIIDFGEAIDLNEPQKVDEEESKTMAGTINFMAPDMIKS